MIEEKPPPIANADNDGCKGLSKNALDLIRNNKLMPYWALFKEHHETLKALERWGLAESRKVRQTTGRKLTWMARLTTKGVRVRDNHARVLAERASKKRFKQQ